MNAKKNTLKNYEFVLTRFENYFGNIELTSITSDNILPFLTKISEGSKQSTKKLRFSLVSAFFNFIKTSYDLNLQNPCDSPALKKIFKDQRPIHWKILEKDVVDEIIFRTENPRNRLMLELMARGGMRVGEVLKLTPNDVEDRKITGSLGDRGPSQVLFRLKRVLSRDCEISCHFCEHGASASQGTNPQSSSLCGISLNHAASSSGSRQG
ncbi:MAG: site-specific integrase [Deltaproteobacteria bacterium]|uniref:Site-specific integrase n=1 Tax=Candidatus Desulfacyla euxinica TaxID=2841693 RepID=A0A8J6MYJ8_9DELT|nr:site-specific integrase [Candidatus Desulfacyla euxinica]